MEIMQAVIMIFIALGGLGVVLTREPRSQVVVLSFYGLLLAIMFVLYQAPAVAYSQIVVGAVVLPFMILLAIARVHRRSKAK